jgi:hypothetical protein
MINPADYHEKNFRLTQALGDKLNAGDATFEPVGFPGLYLLVKQFPHPTISGGQEVEVPMAGGGKYYDQAPIDTSFTGQITFLETTAGTVKQFAQDVLAAGGFFDARIYEGTPDRHTRSYLLERLFFKIDPSDRDWENRAMVLQLSGSLFGNFFGKVSPGNV